MTVPSGSLLPTAQPSPPSNACYRTVKTSMARMGLSITGYYFPADGAKPLIKCGRKSVEGMGHSFPYYRFPLDVAEALLLCGHTATKKVGHIFPRYTFPLRWGQTPITVRTNVDGEHGSRSFWLQFPLGLDGEGAAPSNVAQERLKPEAFYDRCSP